MERLTRTVALLPDVPSTVPALGRGRAALGDTAAPRGGPSAAGATRQQRMLHRRDVHRGQKGGAGGGKTKRGKGSKLRAVADRTGLPVAVSVGSATPHEITLVEAPLAARFLSALPPRLIGDRADDSAPLEASRAEQGIEMIAPHKRNRRRPKSQDGRTLRRSRRRWKGERLFAWLQNFRRLLIRQEYRLDNYRGFVHLACSLILMRRYF